jgi:transposase
MFGTSFETSLRTDLMSKVTILTGPERRRRWSAQERAQILAEAAVPGVRLADVARQHDVSRSRIYEWRREAQMLEQGQFVPVRVEEAPVFQDAADDAVITLDLGDGRSLKISASASPTLVTAALQALR